MPTAKIKDGTTHTRIIRIDLDTAEYIIGKIQDAVSVTINNDTKYIIAPNGDIIGDRAKSTTEMFEEFNDNLQDILNEIKERIREMMKEI